MLTKKILSALALGMIFTSTAAVADPLKESLNIQVTAHIPTESFYVSPNGWDATMVQSLAYSPEDGTLAPIVRSIKMKSTVGVINAKLAYSPEISTGMQTIPLTVWLGGKQLKTAETVEVATAEDAKVAKDASMAIHAEKGGTAYVPGDYAGSVSILFESGL